MADTWDNAEMGGPVGGVEESQPQQIQEKKINKKKLAELEPNGKKLQIFMRDPKTKAVVPCPEIEDVPRDVATTCSDYIYKKIVQQGEPYLMLDDSLGLGLAPYKFVFNWIKTCGEEQNIKDPITDEAGMKPFIDALVVAHKLRIPHASFGQIHVGRAYDSGDDVFNELDIREVCVKSIFEHWFAWKLDGDEEWKIDYMCTLAEMREYMKDLDADLHKAVEDKNQWLKDMKKKRREQDQQTNEGAGAEGRNDGWADNNAGAAAGSGEVAWANQDNGVSGEGTDWMKNNAGAGGATDEWAAEGDTVPTNGADDWAGSINKFAAREPVGVDWADDMNAEASDRGAQSFNPVPIAAGGGW